MKILFIGCVMSSYAFLEALLKNGAEVVGVITKESSEFNSDFKDITPLCIENGIPYTCVKNINEASAIDFIMDKKPDIGYCLGWSQLVKEKVMELFPMGMVGYHPAALPYNRGRHPIIWALALGLKATASSFFMIEKELVFYPIEKHFFSIGRKIIDGKIFSSAFLTKHDEFILVQFLRMHNLGHA